MVHRSSNSARRSDDPDFLAFVEEVRSGLLPGDRILDLGCGSGRLARLLTADRVAVVGIDTDPVAVAALLDDGYPAQTGSAQDLPFGDRSFDVVVGRRVLHHAVDPVRVIVEAVRVARRAVWFEEPTFESPRDRVAGELDRIAKRWDRRLGIPHFDAVTEDQLRQWFRRGLGGEGEFRTELRRRGLRGSNPDELGHRIRPVGEQVGTVWERARFDRLLRRAAAGRGLEAESLVVHCRLEVC